jgi:hypothetical protein
MWPCGAGCSTIEVMRCVVPLLGVALGVGCQNAPAPPAPPAPQAASTPAPPPASDTTGSGSGFVGEAMQAPAVTAEPGHVTLPRTPSTPPNRTTRPLSRKELERLAALEFKDFDRQERGLADRFVEFRHSTRTRPILGVTITIEPCDAPQPLGKAPRRGRNPGVRRTCTPMELDAWKAKGDELKRFLSKQLVGRPDTQFEVGTREVLGTPAIYTYQLGAFFGNDERDQPVGAYSDAYVLYYNDGVNQIRVNACYLDDMIGGVDKLRAVAPQEDLEKLAVAFMSFYLHAWR